MEGAKKMAALMRVESQFDMGASSMHKVVPEVRTYLRTLDEDMEPILLDNEDNQVALLVEQARYEILKQHGDIANSYVQQALEIRKDVPIVMIEQARSSVLMGQPEDALEALTEVLKYNKGHTYALMVKGDALYFTGSFEHALIHYYRALRRPGQYIDKIKFGIKRALRAIDYAVDIEMTHFIVGLMWIFGAMQEYVGRLPKPAPRSNSQHSIKTRKLEKKKAERVTKMKNTKSKKILGPLFDDLIFLKQLDGKAKEQGLDRVAEEAESGIRFIREKEKFWRQQAPSK